MKKIAKNLKMHTTLIIGFSTLFILLLITLYSGYTSAQAILTQEDPQAFLSLYATKTAVLFIIFLIVTFTIAYYIARKLRIEMARLNRIAHELAIGKVDVEIGDHGKDEFGHVLDSFQKVIDNVQYQAGIAEEVANGNFTVEVEPKCDEDLMGLSLSKMVENNYATMSNIKDAAYQVTTSSSQVASASEALAQGSTEQASAIEEITASIDDVADRTKENAAQANVAADLMTKTIEEVKKGNKEMQDMVVAMEDINNASESISKIIKVIDDIAFQTNILALNAAVEAARAGDAGKGFAVVAEEVRNLAAKSAAAAAETADMIEDSIHKIEYGSKIANKTADALAEITNVVKQSETIVNEIAEASNYQATAIMQIDQAIEQVSQVVQTNSATSQQCAAASVELSNQAARVRELVAVYNLGEDSGSNAKKTKATRINAEQSEQVISLKDGFGKY